MKVNQVREFMDKAKLEEEARENIEKVIIGLKDEEELDEKQANQVLEIAKLEAEFNELLADTYEKTAGAIDTYLEDVDKAIKGASKQA